MTYIIEYLTKECAEGHQIYKGIGEYKTSVFDFGFPIHFFMDFYASKTSRSPVKDLSNNI